jgi:hypothetical protein
MKKQVLLARCLVQGFNGGTDRCKGWLPDHFRGRWFLRRFSDGITAMDGRSFSSIS